MKSVSEPRMAAEAAGRRIVLLLAGRGSRLGGGLPKCLTPVTASGGSILACQLAALAGVSAQPIVGAVERNEHPAGAGVSAGLWRIWSSRPGCQRSGDRGPGQRRQIGELGRPSAGVEKHRHPVANPEWSFVTKHLAPVCAPTGGAQGEQSRFHHVLGGAFPQQCHRRANTACSAMA